MEIKEYKCIRCKKVLNKYKPIRLNVFIYNDPAITGGGYKQYKIARVHYDLCRTCFKEVRSFIYGKNK